jgi:hypothetical protein
MSDETEQIDDGGPALVCYAQADAMLAAREARNAKQS